MSEPANKSKVEENPSPMPLSLSPRILVRNDLTNSHLAVMIVGLATLATEIGNIWEQENLWKLCGIVWLAAASFGTLWGVAAMSPSSRVAERTRLCAFVTWAVNAICIYTLDLSIHARPEPVPILLTRMVTALQVVNIGFVFTSLFLDLLLVPSQYLLPRGRHVEWGSWRTRDLTEVLVLEDKHSELCRQNHALYSELIYGRAKDGCQQLADKVQKGETCGLADITAAFGPILEMREVQDGEVQTVEQLVAKYKQATLKIGL